jgi:anti-sigma factor (TIGR02949 family)
MARDLDCNEIVELVTAYLDGALKRRDRKAFERHLKKCGGCTNYVEQICTTIETVGRVKGDDLPQELRDELVAAFRDWRSA